MSVDGTGKRIGRPPRSENQKGRILAEAARLFATNGYESCTIAALAEAMNVSKAAIYHYFQTKREIFEEIAVVTLTGLCETVAAAIDESAPPEQQLKMFMVAHANFFEDHYWYFTAMLTAMGGISTGTASAHLLDIRNRHEHTVRSIIRAGVRTQVFRKTDVATAARAVLSMLNWMARWFRPGGDKRAEDIAIDYYELIYGGIRNTPRT